MNFTREPIIETIISPRDGFKLLVRSSKAGNSEEYYVDAIEVVSFGKSFFFRSTERPKAFLVPTSDYEVLEVKETRVALKAVPHERTIKIGGGREGPVRHREREPKNEEPAAAVSAEATASDVEPAEAGSADMRRDRGRDRRRHRRRRQSDEQEWTDRPRSHEHSETSKAEPAVEGGDAQDETKVSSSMFSSLFPPPTKLISETISSLYQDKEFFKGPPAARPVQEEQQEGEEQQGGEEQEEHPSIEKKEEDPGSDSSSLSRVHVSEERGSFTTTHFSPLYGSGSFNPFF